MLEGCVPWPPEAAEKFRRLGLWEDLTVAEMVERTMRAVPDKTAVVFNDRRISYAELVRSSRRLALALLDLGLRPRDRVVVQLPNVPEFVIAYLALNWMGAIPVEKRGMGAGARMMLTQLGFMISIALALGLVTSVVNPQVLLAVFSGAQTGSSGIDLGPFIEALQLAFAIGVVFSLIGAVVSAMRGANVSIDVSVQSGAAAQAPSAQ